MESLKVGITGGIGSGKSVVAHLLEIMDIPVYDSDMQAKKLTATDPYIKNELIALLGPEVYQGDTLNKSFLASYLFSDTRHRIQVNRIVHPRVKEDFRRWALEHASFPVVGLESAILIEAGFTDTVDKILMVYAPKEIRIKRASLRDSVHKESIIQRMNNQMDEEEKRLQAHFVIENGSGNLLIPQVMEFLGTLPL